MVTATKIELHGKTFNVEKRAGEWQTNYRDAKATTGQTRREAVEALQAMDEAEILKACESHDKTVTRDVYFKDHTNEFQSIFGFTPPRDFLMYALGCGLSLDVIALDKKLRTPDGVSTNNHILKHYGKVALTIVEQMIQLTYNKTKWR